MRYFNFQLSYSVFIPQLFGRLARKVESDSPVGIPGAPGRLVADLKTESPSHHRTGGRELQVLSLSLNACHLNFRLLCYAIAEELEFEFF
jgi:hypothetical protein